MSVRGPELLKVIKRKHWEFEAIKKWMLYLFDYLERFFTDKAKKPSLKVVCQIAFRDNVFSPLKGFLREAVLTQIEGERRGDVVDSGLVGPALHIFVVMGVDPSDALKRMLDVYRTEFERPFLDATREFYRREAQEWATADSCTEYMDKAERRLLQEETRVASYLPAESRRTLMATVEDVLLRQEEARLIHMENSGVQALLRTEHKEQLSRLFRLFSRIDSPEVRDTGLWPIIEIFQSFVTKAGLELHAAEETSNDKAASEDYVRKIMDLHERYCALVAECFGNSHVFLTALKTAFENVFNRNVHGSSTSELLAAYFDRLLRTGKGRVDEGIASDADMDACLDKLVRLFGYLNEKDKFNECYRKMLAKRLLMGRSDSEDGERAVIAKLKFAYGATFTSKLEGMINDMNLSNSRMAEYQEYLRTRTNGAAPGVQVEVHVLQMNHWPTYKVDTLRLPEVFLALMSQFQSYYHAKTASRKLQWVHSLGTVTVKATFEGKTYELSLSTYQAVILVLFNSTEAITVKDLSESLQLSLDEVKRSLAAVMLGKYKILLKDSAGSINAEDVIRVNTKFSDKLVRIKIPNVNTKLSPEEIKATQGTVDTDRQYLVDAAIVRIMKSRKVLSHSNLVAEAIEHLKRYFQPNLPLIKKRIEDLISRDYLRRSANDRSTYEYVA